MKTGVNIGREPALTFSAQAQEPAIDRRRLNLRWLSCTVLTGLAAASLMGGALFIAFDRQSEFAQAPHFNAAHFAHGAFGKSDRFDVGAQSVSSRQVIQETSVRSVGGKEFVKVTPYVRVTASLSMNRGRHSEAAPPFNPLRIFAEVGAWGDDETVAEGEPREDESVSVAFTDLGSHVGRIDEADSLDVAEIEQTIRETVSFVADDVAYAPPVVLPASSPFAPFDGIDAINPLAQAATFDLAHFAGAANSTTIVKQAPPKVDIETEEIGVEVQDGDTLVSILMDHGATRGEAMELVASVDDSGTIPTLHLGDEVRLTVAPAIDDAERLRPVKVTIPQSEGPSVALALAESPVARLASGIDSAMLRRTSTVTPASSSARANVYDGIYETGLSHEVPRDLVDELIRVFSFDVDFQRSVTMGDALEVFYAETGEEEGVDSPQLLYAGITLRGETQHFYRFRAPDDGQVDYYDATGRSAKKFLMRKPLSGGTFRSGFGNRRHPILGYSRMHTGVDWSARTGTPIMASGGGTVIDAQWKSGYGNHVRIRHSNGYESTYSHMSGFGDGVQPGTRVRQGQVIGYVGSTGLSTGPHLHYEVLVNGRHVDPMRIRLPRGRVLEDRVLAAFEKERARIDGLMNRAPASTRVASR